MSRLPWKSKADPSLLGLEVPPEHFKESDIVHCVGCVYWRKFDGGALWACHYCLETGKPRGVMPIMCYKHEGTPYLAKKRRTRKKKDD